MQVKVAIGQLDVEELYSPHTFETEQPVATDVKTDPVLAAASSKASRAY